MKEHEYMARRRYDIDFHYRKLVNILELYMTEQKIHPDELHDAVNLAADRVNYKTFSKIYYHDDWVK